MNVTVRTSNISDASSVHRLLCIIADIHRNGREDIFAGLQSKYTIEQVKERLSKQDNGVFVADINGTVAGYIFCDIITEGNGTTLYIDDLCVDPEIRNQGIGKALMDYAVSYGKECG
ncbi:MAG: GNAT family N-acetyltransferase, partial [Clostridia bacterium]|nr:GNAT family N-acetyltransferase [Clostridia bacterium]